MAISKRSADLMTRSSWIRKMFEEGIRMKADGKGPVWDFSLGSPILEPPAKVVDRLKHLAGGSVPGIHRYMPNPGYDSTRKAVADFISSETGIKIPSGNVIMTVGAAGGLNSVFKAILDPGDEVIILEPFFGEYPFYIDNHGGVAVPVRSKEDFQIDLEAVEALINSRTRAVLVNSPNNPSGVIYSRQSLENLAVLLRSKGRESGSEIYIISDEAYRKIIYRKPDCPGSLAVYENTIMVTSHSKDLGLAGERIGWVAVNPSTPDAGRLIDAIVFSLRALGYVNAPSIFQKTIEECLDVSVDIGWYKKRRDLLCEALADFGYEFIKPDGAFYLFPKAPGGDDLEFCRVMASRRVLVVPGRGFGMPGYFRIAYCVGDGIIEGALPEFKAAI